MSQLTGKRTLITGGTTGIGLETARRFLEEGARVAITGQNPQNLEAAKAQLPEAVVIASDAGQVAGQKVLAEQILAEFGGLDALFVNAGIAVFQPVEAWDEAAFDRQMDINFKGPYFLLQAMLPLLSNPSSVILNSSVAGYLGLANAALYSATKAALQSLSRSLSVEWAARGIRVNTVSPGPISTPIFDKMGLPVEAAAQLHEHLQQQVPAGRFGVPREIADAVVFLASDSSSYMVGTDMLIDGGMRVA